MHKDVNLGKKKGLKSIEVMVLVPMTSDLDIYRSAHERIKQHDEDAPTPVPKRRSSPHMASGMPLPGPGAGRRRRVDGPRLRQITGTSADRRVGGGRGPRFPLPAHRRGRLRPLSPTRGRKPGTIRYATLTDSGRRPPGAGPVAPRGSWRIRRRPAQGRRSPPFFFPLFPFWPRSARLSWRLLPSAVPGV